MDPRRLLRGRPDLRRPSPHRSNLHAPRPKGSRSNHLRSGAGRIGSAHVIAFLARVLRRVVTCHLGGIGEQDTTSVTVGRGETQSLTLQAMGGQATGEGPQAFDVSCTSLGSSYVVANVRMEAIRLDKAKLQ